MRPFHNTNPVIGKFFRVMTQQGIYNEVEETQVRTEGDGFKRCLSDFMSDCAIAEMYRAIATTELAEVPIESLSETGNLDPEH